MKSKTAILVALFVISVTTLVLAIFGDNRVAFGVATVIAHMALIGFGYFYSRSKNDIYVQNLRNDIFGK